MNRQILRTREDGIDEHGIDERGIDARDIFHRDLVERRHFSPGRVVRSFSWTRLPGLAVSFGLALLACRAAPAGAALYVVRPGASGLPRGARPAADSYPPVEGRPTPAWYQVSGKWRSERDGFLAEAAGELRSDAIDLGRSDFTAAVLADVSGASGAEGERKGGRERGLGAALLVFHIGGIGEVGGLRAGLAADGSAFVAIGGTEIGGDLLRKGPVGPTGRRRFWLIVETDDGLVSVRAGRSRAMVARDVYRRLDAGGPGGVGVGVGGGGGVSLRAAAGVVVYAVKIRTLPRRDRPETLRSGDEALSAGRRARAGALYSEALMDEALLPRERAEAAYKLGLVIKDSDPPPTPGDAARSGLRRAEGASAPQAGPRRCPDDAARAFGRAKDLDPEGPWGERARLELARAALGSGEEDVALAFAHMLVRDAAPGIEEWRGLKELVSAARERLVAARQGARATHQLRRIAEYLEWAGSARERALWAWNEVALSYSGRGWYAEAEAVRGRAERALAEGGFFGRLKRRLFGAGRSKDAPSVLPEPEADRILREKRLSREKKAAK